MNVYEDVEVIDPLQYGIDIKYGRTADGLRRRSVFDYDGIRGYVVYVNNEEDEEGEGE